MKLGFDVDEVVADIMTPALKVVNEINGTSYHRFDIRDFNLECIGINDTIGFFHKYAKDIFDMAEPVEGAQDYLNKLKDDGHELHFITARNYPDVDYEIRRWFQQNEVPFDSIRTKSEHKGEACIENEISVYFDDYDVNVERAIECRVPAYLVDRPWNQRAWIPRVMNWRGIYEVVKYHSNGSK